MLNFYEYLKLKGAKKVEVDQFLNSSTAQEIVTTIDDLQEYIKGGKDNLHSQLREGYGHIPKPQARKISTYLESILHDAYKYSNDRKEVEALQITPTPKLIRVLNCYLGIGGNQNRETNLSVKV